MYLNFFVTYVLDLYKQPITWFDYVKLPCAARKRRALRNSHPFTVCSDSPRAIPSFSVLLGCVKWQKCKDIFSLFCLPNF